MDATLLSVGTILFATGIGVGLLLWISARVAERRTGAAPLASQSPVPLDLASSNDAVIVAQPGGRIVFINDHVREWFGLEVGAPDLWLMAQQVVTSEAFLQLFATEGRATFQLNDRRIEATSHQIMMDGSPQLLVVMREQAPLPSLDKKQRDGNQIMLVISELSRSISASLDLNATLNAILSDLEKLITYDAGELALWEPERNLLRPVGRVGDDSYHSASRERDGESYSINSGYSGWIARHHKPLVISNVTTRTDIESRLNLAELGYRSFIGVPLMIRNRFIGTLELVSREYDAYDADDLSLLNIVADQAAIAIENARLYGEQEERVAELSGLQEIAQALSTLQDPYQLYAQLNEHLARLMQVEMSAILLYDPDKQALIPQTPGFGVPEAITSGLYSIPLAQGSPARVLWDTSPFWYSNNAREDQLVADLGLTEFALSADVMTTALCKMTVGNEDIGVVQIANKLNSTAFTNIDMRLLQIYAAQAAIVVENARLYSEEQNRVAELQGLHEISQAMSAITDSNELYAQLSARIGELMQVAMCGILFYDEEQSALVSRPPFYGVVDSLVVGYQLPLPQGSRMRRIWEEDDIFIVADVATDPIVKEVGLDQLAQAVGVNSTLYVPLSSGGRRFGVIQVSNKLDGAPFDHDDARILSIFASQAAALIENARLYEETGDTLRNRIAELRSVSRISRELNATLELDRILMVIADEAVRAEGASCGSVLMTNLNAALPNRTVASRFGCDDDVLKQIEGHALDSGEAVLVEDFHTNPDFEAPHPGIRSALVVPVRYDGTYVGTISLHSDKPDTLGPSALEFVTALADQAAIAVSNTLRHEDQVTSHDLLRRRAEQLTQIFEVGRLFRTDQSLAESLEAMAGAISEAVGFDIVLLSVIGEAGQSLDRTASAGLAKSVFDELRRTPQPVSQIKALMRDEFSISGSYFIAHDHQSKAEAALKDWREHHEEVMRKPGQWHPNDLLLVPLYSKGGALIGALQVDAPRDGHIPDRQIVETLEIFANQAAAIIENSRLYRSMEDRADELSRSLEDLEKSYQELDEISQEMMRKDMEISRANLRLDLRARRLLALHRVMESVDTTQMPGQVLQDISRAVVREMEVDVCVIALDTHAAMDHPTLSLVATAGKVPSGVDLDSLLTGNDPVTRTHGGEDVRLLTFDKNGNPPGPLADALGLRSMVTLPLELNETERGVVLIGNQQANESLSDDDIDLFTLLASQISVEYENASLYNAVQIEARTAKTERDRLEQLHQITTQLEQSISLEDRLLVIPGGLRPLGFGKVAVLMFNPDMQVTHLVTDGYSPTAEKKMRRSLPNGDVWREFFKAKDFQILKADNNAYYLPHDHPWVSENEWIQTTVGSPNRKPNGRWHPNDLIYIPLYVGDRIMGLISLGEFEAEVSLTPESLRPIELFAQQAASALENTRLYQETASLQSFNEAVVESIQQGIMVLENDLTVALTNEFLRHLDPSGAGLVGRNLFEVFPSWGEIGLQEDLNTVQIEREPRQRLNVNYDPPGRSPTLLNFYMYPLSIELGDESLVVLVEDITAHAQLQEDIALRGQQLAALSQVSRVITSTLSAEDVIDSAISGATGVLAFDRIALWLRDESTDTLHMVRSQGYPKTRKNKLEKTAIPPASNVIFSGLAHDQQPLVIASIKEDERYAQELGHTKGSWLAAPLISHGTMVGVLVAEKNEPNYYSPADGQVALAFANQVAIAMENAQLYQHATERAAELDKRTQRLALLNRISAGLGTSLELDNILNSALAELVKATGGDQGSVVLISTDDPTMVQVATNYPPDIQLPTTPVPFDGTLMDRFGDSLRPITIEDVQNDPVLASADPIMQARQLAERKVKSMLIAPLVAAGEMFGTVTVDYIDGTATFEPDQIELAQSIASQVSVAIANARLFEETAERGRELEILFSASQAASSSLDLSNVLTGIGRFLTEAVPVDGYTISLWNREANTLVTQLDFARPTTNREVESKGTVYHLAQLPLSRRVLELRKREIVYINDPEADPQEVEWMESQNIKVNLMIPLVTRGATIGMLELWHGSEDYKFTPSDLRLGQALANQAATAIENARLHDETQQRVEELATINQIGRAITSSIRADDLYETLYEQLAYAMGAKSMIIALYDSVTQTISFPLHVINGEKVKREAEPVGKDFYAHMVRHGTPLKFSDDVAAKAAAMDIANVDPDLKAFLAIPFFSGDRPAGALAVLDYEDPHAFGNTALRILETTGAQVGVAIQNARLYDQLQRRLGETTALQEVSRVVNTSLDLQEILERVTDELAFAFDYPRISLFTLEGNELVLRAYHGYPQHAVDQFKRIPATKGLIGRVATTGMPLYIQDVTKEKEYVAYEDWVTTNIVIPISSDERVLGIINIDSGAGRPLSPNDMSLTTTLAGQVATAMENARLYDQMISMSAELERRVEERTHELQEERDTIDTLFRITSELSASLDLDRVLNRALELVGQAVGAEHGSLFLVDPQSDKLIYRAVMSDYEVLPPGGREIPLTRHEGMAGWVMSQREAVVVDNVQDHPRWVNLPGTEDRRSMLASPLIASEDVLGVMIMLSDEVGVFSEAHKRLVEAAANQVATAINNAELYRLIRDQAERLGSMLRSQQVEASKSQAILESVADGVMVSNAAGEIILFNAASERILDLERSEVLGRPSADLTGLYGAGGRRWAETMELWTSDPTSYTEGEFLAERINVSDKVVSIHVSPVSHGDEFLGLVSVFRDITREVEVDRIKSEFVATVSHELRTPMTSIKGYADLLLMGAAGSLTDEQRRFLDIIRSNADRLSLLVNDLLDISRIEQGRLELEIESMKIADVISTVMESMEGRQLDEQKDIDFIVEVDEDLPVIEADHDRVAQILVNIVTNAFHYTPEGGSVTVQAFIENGELRMNVTDTGIGIAPQDMARIFDRFYRGEDPLVMATAGTGLGLSIVQHLIDMHHGRLEVESELGSGTTFSVFLPLSQPEDIHNNQVRRVRA